MTVTTVLLTVMSSARASSAVPWKARRSSGEPGATVTWDIAEPTASAASPATPGSTHNAPLTYSLRAYQATDRRTRRTKPSELELGFINQATAGEPRADHARPWQLRVRRGSTITGFSSLQNHWQQARPDDL